MLRTRLARPRQWRSLAPRPRRRQIRRRHTHCHVTASLMPTRPAMLTKACVGRRRAIHLPVASNQFLFHAASHFKTIFPTCWLDSISAWAWVAAPGIRAGKHAVDHRLDAPALQPRPHRGTAGSRNRRLECHGARTQGRAGDGQPLAQHQPSVDFALYTALHRDDDQTAIVRQALHFLGHIAAGHHVQHHIHTTTVGQAQGLRLEVLGFVVDGMVGAQGQASRALFVAARRGNHRGAQGLGQLDGSHANATGTALHQQGFARLADAPGRTHCSTP